MAADALCRICKSWSYLRKYFKYLCHINVEDVVLYQWLSSRLQ